MKLVLAAPALIASLVVPSAFGLANTAVQKSGTTNYTTHFVFVPKSTVDIPGVGKAIALEAVGPTENTDGQPFLDKMQAKCAVVKVDVIEKVDAETKSTAGRTYLNGACALTDADGDVVFSTFDTRDLDKSLPKMDCGTHIVTGGTGKYKGITGREPFACITKPTPAGAPEGAFAIEIPHITTWEIKG